MRPKQLHLIIRYSHGRLQIGFLDIHILIIIYRVKNLDIHKIFIGFRASNGYSLSTIIY